MTATLDSPPAQTPDGQPDYDRYRSLSGLAVGSLIVGFLSLLSIFSVSLLPLAVVGVGFGLFTIRTVDRNRDLVTGRKVAITGTVLSALALVLSPSRYYYEEYVNIPEGYEVMAFGSLQPDLGNTAVVPEKAWKYDGKRVLINGYVYPHDQKEGLNRFVLVPDFDTCCFGGQPKLTDMIEVRLRDPLRVNWSYNRRKIGGTLTINKHLHQMKDLTGVYYEIDADYVK
ncbi:DUF3299 domain-containing protein [Blastopirellula marina]|uniref:DUF4190 domain-containing protein n=1 Tax=Blastopirellula marina DSM 3645 TaxID=314230 RepID=A3ZN52_9BACT|nr:DUF3299 domain-containing protein [Blastopirellula marina]EAQ82381.1 hypothetical protein DSM3645_01665 [Blastopirellula marina DSM 3645]